MSSSVLESNLSRLDLPLFSIKHLQPKALKYDTFGFLPLKISYGVSFKTGLIRTLFST